MPSAPSGWCSWRMSTGSTRLTRTTPAGPPPSSSRRLRRRRWRQVRRCPSTGCCSRRWRAPSTSTGSSSSTDWCPATCSGRSGASTSARSSTPLEALGLVEAPDVVEEPGHGLGRLVAPGGHHPGAFALVELIGQPLEQRVEDRLLRRYERGERLARPLAQQYLGHEG